MFTFAFTPTSASHQSQSKFFSRSKMKKKYFPKSKNSSQKSDKNPLKNWKKVLRQKVNSLNTITLGAGRFWLAEAAFSRLRGVTSAVSGYSNGHTENPTYEQV